MTTPRNTGSCLLPSQTIGVCSTVLEQMPCKGREEARGVEGATKHRRVLFGFILKIKHHKCAEENLNVSTSQEVFVFGQMTK